jgi:NHS family xanthosine MFS transporter
MSFLQFFVWAWLITVAGITGFGTKGWSGAEFGAVFFQLLELRQ